MEFPIVLRSDSFRLAMTFMPSFMHFTTKDFYKVKIGSISVLKSTSKNWQNFFVFRLSCRSGFVLITYCS